MSTTPLNLCLNCLAAGASGVDVGPEKGSQRDPYRDELQLCDDCKAALLAGDFARLASRYSVERTVRRGNG